MLTERSARGLSKILCSLPISSHLGSKCFCLRHEGSIPERKTGGARCDRLPLQVASSCFVAQSCPTLCDPMDCSPLGSSVHGILQAGILETVAMPSSGGSSRPRDQTCLSYVSCIGRWVLYHWRHLGSLRNAIQENKRLSFFSPLSFN